MASSSAPLTARLSVAPHFPEPIDLPLGLLIDGQFKAGRGTPIETHNPSTELAIVSGGARVHGASAADVDDAVKAARRAFETTWGTNTPGTERAALMRRLADLIERDLEKLAVVEALDAGKPIGWAKADISDCVACLRYYAGWADKIIGQALEVNDATKLAFTRHEPVGVVGQVVPWNYPVMMWGWKVAPALAVGCSIVFKPAENTPLSTLLIGALFKEAGFPDGVFNVVNGLGRETGSAISEHKDINKIAFTGSTDTGRAITIAAAKTNLKKVTLELGGKSANIVFDKADVDQAVQWSALAVFENAGQSCSAGSRVLVHESVLKQFEEGIKAAAERIKVGDVLDASTDQGPQISKVQFDKILSYIELGKKEGAKVLTGGHRVGLKGYFVKPTVFTGVRNDMRIAREEIFGPVLVVIPFKTEEEAITLANDSNYGLAAALHTKDADQIMRVGNKLKAGTVWVNSYTWTANNVPFGGYKTSGWGRELGSYGLEEYTNVKAIHWNYGEKMQFPVKL